MLKLVIVEDEPLSRSLIQTYVNQYCTDCEIVGIAEDANEAFDLIDRLRPNVLLLDIEIANESSPENSFELLARLPNYQYEIIFITAFNHYALKAIKVRALDYLMKPLNISELQNALKLAATRLSNSTTENYPKPIDDLIQNLKNTSDKAIDKIWILHNNEYVSLELTTIIRFEADGRYTLVITEKKKYYVTKNLKEFIDLLQETDSFFQIHRSFFINTKKIDRFVPGEEDQILMNDGILIPIARRRKQEFLENFIK